MPALKVRLVDPSRLTKIVNNSATTHNNYLLAMNDNFDFQRVFLSDEAAASPLTVLLHLVAALLLGMAVAGIYLKTTRRGEFGSSFPITLVLLAVLIAMVTQVIGSNVARAFSLVGALSVVRFRTVVRDTRDTAYVIFAVVIGMAAGAANLWVAVLGLLVIAVAAVVGAHTKWLGNGASDYILRVRTALGRDPEQLMSTSFDACLAHHELIGVATSKQGVGMEYSYEVALRPQANMVRLLSALSAVEGVLDVRCERREDN